MLLQNHEDIVKLHALHLMQEADRCRVGQQVLDRRREVSQLNRKAMNNTKEKQSIIGRLISIGIRMF
ncbi:hypothetical protein [Paenibacillus antarcticus]|uniref:Uncharacterized protein n=1 Tax=Paenibacillus antarcticus TaxID=253703 RepID=A0A168QL18_9BACL|nr:hypothetical protein [Paenibacillus antarcticus]OAB47906.1 hypothetical protein PBAT_03260 [Paenibacillus antarcticus]